jgi:hypothetical protein
MEIRRTVPAVVVVLVERGLDFAGWTSMRVAVALWGIAALLAFWAWVWPFLERVDRWPATAALALVLVGVPVLTSPNNSEPIAPMPNVPKKEEETYKILLDLLDQSEDGSFTFSVRNDWDNAAVVDRLWACDSTEWSLRASDGRHIKRIYPLATTDFGDRIKRSSNVSMMMMASVVSTNKLTLWCPDGKARRFNLGAIDGSFVIPSHSASIFRASPYPERWACPQIEGNSTRMRGLDLCPMQLVTDRGWALLAPMCSFTP